MTATHDFELVREETIEEYDLQARIYRHVGTGAELLSIIADDENKVFGVSFATPPADSTGIAHIMEHAVLGGSEKYPLKEPFVQLIKGSLNTFLNAFTSPDKTTYPVASANLQDFYNLVDVYLDAVFHPLITPYHLEQEGWHYELDAPDDPLTYKGVVFNEMKGVYSSPDAVLGRTSQHALFPDNAYANDSGGDPRVIPDLTYQQFTDFHAAYYHPSNARFFFYGDDDPEERLRILESVITGYEQRDVDGSVALQAAPDRPRRVVEFYGVNGEEDVAGKSRLMLNWLLPEQDDPELGMALSVLSYALVGAQSAPLRKTLVDSGLAEDVIGDGISAYLRQMTFSVGLKNLAGEDIDAAEALILTALADLAETGIDEDMVDAALNSMEFALRENNTGPYPRGLSIYMQALSRWLYGGDPLEAIRFEKPLDALRTKLAEEPDYLQSLMRTYLLDNPPVTVVLTPDPGLNAAQEEAEQARLDAAKAAMSPDDIQAVMKNTQTLRELQNRPDSPEDLAKLPSLTLGDLDPSVSITPTDIGELDGATFLAHDLFTNGIVYLNLGFNLHVVPQELLPYARFLGKAFIQMGTESEDYVKFSRRIDRTTGGVYPSTYVSPARNQAEGVARFFLNAKATVAQTPEMLAILRDMLLTVKLDDPVRLRQIVLESKARLEAGLIPSGHSYVSGRLHAHFTPADWADEQMAGIDYLFFVRRLAQEMETDWPGVLAKLRTVQQLLINRQGLLINLTLDDENRKLVQPQISAMLDELPGAPAQDAVWQPATLPAPEGLAIPAQVNYVGKGANLYELGYAYHGSIHVITNLVRTGWLWDKVRAQGGAYGAFCRFDRQGGVWTYLSYRDPNLATTLENYDATARFLSKADISQDELTKSIIGAIGNLDAYQLPDAKGRTAMHRYFLGVTEAERQQSRDEVLGTTVDDIRRFADVLQAAAQAGTVVAMGSDDALQASDIPFTVTKVL
ncbi:MAG: insulinase family protein [Caldilineaceae bacterium]|nr:insulinase family protein [Caldilineaceae bacterium]